MKFSPFYIAFALVAILAVVDSHPVINVILMGSTGNLAQKYLWQGLFNIHMQNLLKPEHPQLSIWPVATKSRAVSQPQIDAILADNVTSAKPHQKEFFLPQVNKYHQLSASSDYAVLQASISQRMKNLGEVEVGRLIYMSVPPKVFGPIAKEINTSLRPQRSDAWLKVIVEKPFGVDLVSADELAHNLFVSLKEKEVLLVDHYMGKFGLVAMREFHHLNRNYVKKLFDSKSVKEIVIDMVETEHCAGRTFFYDEVGVIRDTMQNHLMMMLSLFLMEVHDHEEEDVARMKVIHNIRKAALVDTTLGQYQDYNKHILEEITKAYGPDVAKRHPTSYVPTYAKVKLVMNGGYYDKIPITLTSGKALAKRRAYLKLVTVDGGELIFNVQGEVQAKGEKINEAAVYASEKLPPFNGPVGWTEKSKRFFVAPDKLPSAYQVLLSDALHGKFSSFVKIPEVIASWKVWNDLLVEIAAMKSKVPLTLYDYGGVGLKDGENDKSNTGRQEL